ncbi:hypothetical protein GCM10009122_53240 [Fulvivirga kasyanovii]|uniref:DUF4382 domain-containing protein n=1 Tax=Fulvivirga kasyanovii TaxID=396812 RepID=A0ABW9RJ59_9BACT|nr:hypothetical protein [Fulvivirga kasyanovii]MTI24099.1 hypothetical protein [Fulvivirga kasyanovii]
MKKIVLALSIFLPLFTSCDQEETPLEVKKGEVQFGIDMDDVKSATNGRLSDDVNIEDLTLSIEFVDENGELSVHGLFGISKLDYDQKPWENDKYVTETFLLPEGSYTIERFNLSMPTDDNSPFYATPYKGSNLAYLVDKPLPIKIEVLAGQLTTTSLEVIDTEGREYEEYGYDVGVFEVVELADLQYIAYTYDKVNDELVEIGTTVTIYNEAGKKLFDRFITPGLAYITMRADGWDDTHTIIVEKNGYKTKSFEFRPGDYFVNNGTPLQVTLEKELE